MGREAQDASAALFDRDGRVIAQAELIPMQLGPKSDIFRACADVVPPNALREGDFYINNDPYGGGQHLQDVFIFSPVFVDSELVAFAGTVSHHLDLGGAIRVFPRMPSMSTRRALSFRRRSTTSSGTGTAGRWSAW
ncbi:MAG: hypothetical protein CM1200mP20_02780 [Pseudomonadota bacterium]|nr:MAG: hypothetical protein CM1200mP20_02780 [Pseudomonadota bacterium]